MEPLYFGVAERQLFGLYFEAQSAPRNTRILVCASWGMEYMRSYRALSLLSRQLSELGFETLRFDYSSTGDSHGQSGKARLPEWTADIQTAARELTSLGGTGPLCILGLRLGALLALHAVRGGLRADRLILWDMPQSGSQWLKQMHSLEAQEYVRQNRYRTLRNQIGSGPQELLGMPFDDQLAESLSGLTSETQDISAPTLHMRSKDEVREPATTIPVLQLADEAHWTDPSWLTTPWTPSGSIRQTCDELGRWLK